MLNRVNCHWSRLTIEWRARWWDQLLTFDSCLLHACSRACFIHVFVADLLQVSFKQTNYRVMSSITRSIIICSCSRLTSDSCLQHVTELVLFVDLLNQEINRDLLIHVCNVLQSLFCSCLLHSIELVLFMSITFDKACSVRWLTQ